MGHFFLFSASVIILTACKSSGNKTEAAGTDTTQQVLPKEENVIKPVKITQADIPPGLNMLGQINEAWKWTDKLGENVFYISQVPPYGDNGGGEEGQTAELYIRHYAKKAGDANYAEVWSAKDEVKQCPVDITCEFVPGAATVTDLDANGIAETKVQYKLACRGDVSPSTMKLILVENGVRYTLTGDMWAPIGPEVKYDVTEQTVNLEKIPKPKDESEEYILRMGRYESEKDFINAPSQFLNFARAEWLKYSKEKFGE